MLIDLFKLLFIINVFTKCNEFTFVRLDKNSSIYLLNRGRSQLISYNNTELENITVKSFDFNLESISTINESELLKYPSHFRLVPPVKKNDFTTDECMRVHVLRVKLSSFIVFIFNSLLLFFKLFPLLFLLPKKG